jgi:hypothetical protein
LCVAFAKTLKPAVESWREAGAHVGIGAAFGEVAFWLVIVAEGVIGLGLLCRRSRYATAWLSLLWAGAAGIARPALVGRVFPHDCGCLGAFGTGLGRGGVAAVSMGYMLLSYAVVLLARSQRGMGHGDE